ncbi:MAG: hypothetical protein U0269_16195 [Polyangiales bacterium]
MRPVRSLAALALIALAVRCQTPPPAVTVTEAPPRTTSVRDATDATDATRAPAPVIAPVAAPENVPSERDTSAAISDAESPPQPVIEAPASEVSVTVYGDTSCTFRMTRHALRPQCTSGSMSCAERARGRITREDADDVVSLCEFSETHAEFVVVSTEDAVRFAVDAMGEAERQCADYESQVSLIEAGRDPLRALLVQARGCSEPGKSIDSDSLYHWSHSSMRQVASERFECIFLETRLPPSNATPNYQCEGNYLVPSAANRSTINVVGHRIAVRQRALGEGRLMRDNGHIQRRIRWSEVLAPDR